MKSKSAFILILLCLITTTIYCEDAFQSDDGVSHLLAKSIDQKEIAIPLATVPPKNINHRTEAIQHEGNPGWKSTLLKNKDSKPLRGTGSVPFPTTANHPTTRSTKGRVVLDSRRTSGLKDLLSTEPSLEKFTSSERIKNSPATVADVAKTSKEALRMQPLSASSASAKPFSNTDGDTRVRQPKGDGGWKPSHMKRTAVPFKISTNHPTARGTKENDPGDAKKASTIEYELSKDRSVDKLTPPGGIKNTPLALSGRKKTSMEALMVQPTASSTDTDIPIANSDTDTEENIPQSKQGRKPTSDTDEQTEPSLDATLSSFSIVTHLRMRNTKGHDRIDSRETYGSERPSPVTRNLHPLVTFDGMKSPEVTPEKPVMEGFKIYPQSASIASDKLRVNLEIDTPTHVHGNFGHASLKSPSPRGSRTPVGFGGATPSNTDGLFRTQAKDPLHHEVSPLEDEQPETHREPERKRRDHGSEENSSSERHEKHRFPPRGKPKVTERGGGTQHFRPSKQFSTTHVDPKFVHSTGPRWQIAFDSLNRQDSGNGKHAKKKKKKGRSRAKDPADSGAPGIVAGIFAGILVLTFIITGLIRLWLKCRRRRTLSFARLDEDYDDDDIVFERKQSGNQANHTSPTASSTNATSPPCTPSVSPAASPSFTDSPTRKQTDHSVTVMTCTVSIPVDANEFCSSCIVPVSEVSDEPKFAHDDLPPSKEPIFYFGNLRAEEEACPDDAKIRDPSKTSVMSEQPINCVSLIPEIAVEEFSPVKESETTILQQGREEPPVLVESCDPSDEEQPKNRNVLIPEIAFEIPTFEEVSSGASEAETTTSQQGIEEPPVLVSFVPSNEEHPKNHDVLIPEVALNISTFEEVLPCKESETTTLQQEIEGPPALVKSCAPSEEEQPKNRDVLIPEIALEIPTFEEVSSGASEAETTTSQQGIEEPPVLVSFVPSNEEHPKNHDVLIPEVALNISTFEEVLPCKESETTTLQQEIEGPPALVKSCAPSEEEQPKNRDVLIPEIALEIPTFEEVSSGASEAETTTSQQGIEEPPVLVSFVPSNEEHPKNHDVLIPEVALNISTFEEVLPCKESETTTLQQEIEGPPALVKSCAPSEEEQPKNRDVLIPEIALEIPTFEEGSSGSEVESTTSQQEREDHPAVIKSCVASEEEQPKNRDVLIPEIALELPTFEEASSGSEVESTTLQQGREDHPALVKSFAPSEEEQPKNRDVLIPEIALELTTFEEVSSGLEAESTTSQQEREEPPALVKSCATSEEEQPKNRDVLILENAPETPAFEEVSSSSEAETTTLQQGREWSPALLESCDQSNEKQSNNHNVLIPEIALDLSTFKDVLPCKESKTTTSQQERKESPVLIESCDPSNEEGKAHPNSVHPCTKSNEFQPVRTSFPDHSVNSSHGQVPLLGNDGHRTCSMESVSCIVPDPPVAPPISSATTALRQGKSHIGGKKALENRRYIKHFTSGKYTLNLKGQLDHAVARIFGHKTSLPDRSKEKRVVMRRITQEAGRTMVESILLAKEIILDEKRDKLYDLKSSEHRRAIRRGIVPTSGHRYSLQELINFSRKVILSSCQERNADFRGKEVRNAISTEIEQWARPSFEIMIRVAESSVLLDKRVEAIYRQRNKRMKGLEHELKPSDSPITHATSSGSVVSHVGREPPSSKDKSLDRAKSCIIYIPEEALEAHTYGEISPCSEADIYHSFAEEKGEQSTAFAEPCVLSCEKEQLHACSENVCRKPDESKPACESSSDYSCEKTNEEAPTVIVDGQNACPVISMECAVPVPPVAPSTSTAATIQRKGKSQIGSKKALENRRYIKHFTTGKYASNFKGELDQAVTRILGHKKSLTDSNKEKRAVIKRLTQEGGRTMVGSILLAKGIILNEKVNKIFEMKSLESRRVIQRANGRSRDRRTPFEELINFSRKVIASSEQERKAERRRREIRKVIGAILGQFYRPSFEIMLQTAGSTIKIDEQIKAVMQRNERNHWVIRADAECLKEQGSIVRDISFVHKVICQPIINDHKELPKPRCYCYRCLRLIDVKNLPKEWTQTSRRKKGKRSSRKSTSMKPHSRHK